jgi:hypothetical protein
MMYRYFDLGILSFSNESLFDLLISKDTLHEIGIFFSELRFIFILILQEHDLLDPNHFKP